VSESESILDLLEESDKDCDSSSGCSTVSYDAEDSDDGGVSQDSIDNGVNLDSDDGGVNQDTDDGRVNQDSIDNGVNLDSDDGGVNQDTDDGGVNKDSIDNGVNLDSDDGGVNHDSNNRGRSNNDSEYDAAYGSRTASDSDCRAVARNKSGRIVREYITLTLQRVYTYEGDHLLGMQQHMSSDKWCDTTTLP